jgi:hypothetical protein
MQEVHDGMYDMKKRILRVLLALDGILLLVIAALYLADRMSGVSCEQRFIMFPYLGCSRFATAALLLQYLLLYPMLLTLPILLVVVLQAAEAALRRLMRDRRRQRGV